MAYSDYLDFSKPVFIDKADIPEGFQKREPPVSIYAMVVRGRRGHEKITDWVEWPEHVFCEDALKAIKEAYGCWLIGGSARQSSRVRH